MTLIESIKKLKTIIIDTKKADVDLTFFIESELALLYEQLNEYLETEPSADINFVKNILNELEQNSIDITAIKEVLIN